MKSIEKGNPERKRTDEPQENWEKTWTEYAQPGSQNKRLKIADKARRRPTATQTREQAEHAEGDDKDEDEDYVPSEEPSSKDPTYEPTRRELRRANKEGDQ